MDTDGPWIWMDRERWKRHHRHAESTIGIFYCALGSIQSQLLSLLFITVPKKAVMSVEYIGRTEKETPRSLVTMRPFLLHPAMERYHMNLFI